MKQLAEDADALLPQDDDDDCGGAGGAGGGEAGGGNGRKRGRGRAKKDIRLVDALHQSWQGKVGAGCGCGVVCGGRRQGGGQQGPKRLLSVLRLVGWVTPNVHVITVWLTVTHSSQHTC